VRSVVQLYPGPLAKLQYLIDLRVGEVLCFEGLCEVWGSSWAIHTELQVTRPSPQRASREAHAAVRIQQRGGASSIVVLHGLMINVERNLVGPPVACRPDLGGRCAERYQDVDGAPTKRFEIRSISYLPGDDRFFNLNQGRLGRRGGAGKLCVGQGAAPHPVGKITAPRLPLP
jgi:hypothetical protein